MTGPIFVLNPEGALVPIYEREYETEDVFQELLAKYPELLLGGDDRTPYSGLLLIAREQGIPIEEGGGNYFSLDHLFVDQNGVPTLVEVKRRSDTRNRREIVAQMLDYASNGLITWTVDDLRRNFEKTCAIDNRDPADVLGEFLGVEGDSEAFWQSIRVNIQNERIRMVFVADEISLELRRIISFLNRQMRTSEMLAIELKQFIGEGVRAFVPDVIVKREAASGSSGSAAISRTDAPRWTEARFFAALAERAGPEAVAVARALQEWGAKNMTEFWWGKGRRDGSFAPVLIWNEVDYYPFFVWTSGVADIQFQWLQYRPPFDSTEKRKELLDRLNMIPGVMLPEDSLTRRPSFPLTALLPAESLAKFIGVMDWVIAEIKGMIP